MCGLFGIINTDNSDVKEEVLWTCLKAISHRGPDHSQVWSDKFVGLAHQRLSIIDPSEVSNQPLIYKSLRIIFNGAIYNYIELREELEAVGYTFKTSSDTEVICASYLNWGPEFLNRLNGMWAFLIFDERDDSVFISRDRFGIKPLMYTTIGDSLYFSSEVKAILQLPGYSASLNYNMAKRFLRSGITQYQGKSFFHNVFYFPPGSYGLFKDGELKTHRYYQLKENLDDKLKKLSFHSAKEKFRSLFRDAVKIRLRSDVDMGSSLSGGLDSNVIAANVFELDHGEEFRTFSVCFDEFSKEEALIDIANTQFNFNVIKIRPNDQNLINRLQLVCWHQEQPVPTGSILAQNYLFELVSKSGVKAVLGGQGADEIAYGYDAFIKLKLKSNPFRFLEAPFFYTKLFYDHLIKEPSSLAIKHDINDPTDNTNDIQDHATHMIEHEPLPALLHFEDRNAMQFGIESRLPYLDHRVVEFCLSCPPDFFNKGNKRKSLIKEAFSHKVPKEILNHKQKNAFASPQSSWVNENRVEIEEFIKDRFDLIEEFLFEDQSSVSKFPSAIVWRILNFIIFRERFAV